MILGLFEEPRQLFSMEAMRLSMIFRNSASRRSIPNFRTVNGGIDLDAMHQLSVLDIFDLI